MAIEMLTAARPPGAHAARRGVELAAGVAQDTERLASFCAVALAGDMALRPRTAQEFQDCMALALQPQAR